jgi:hypothetical protein
VEPEEATTNVMQMGHWVEGAWLYLGEVDLAAGEHSWKLRYPIPERGRFLMGLDTLAGRSIWKHGNIWSMGEYPRWVELTARLYDLAARVTDPEN